jgi:hypothetical protein
VKPPAPSLRHSFSGNVVARSTSPSPSTSAPPIVLPLLPGNAFCHVNTPFWLRSTPLGTPTVNGTEHATSSSPSASRSATTMPLIVGVGGRLAAALTQPAPVHRSSTLAGGRVANHDTSRSRSPSASKSTNPIPDSPAAGVASSVGVRAPRPSFVSTRGAPPNPTSAARSSSPSRS